MSQASEGAFVGHVSLIPLGEGRVFAVAGRDVAVFRLRDGGVFATQATCPHLGGPLTDGIVADGKVVCPLHGMQFDLASGDPIGHLCGHLTVYPVRMSNNGDLFIAEEPSGKRYLAKAVTA